MNHRQSFLLLFSCLAAATPVAAAPPRLEVSSARLQRSGPTLLVVEGRAAGLDGAFLRGRLFFGPRQPLHFDRRAARVAGGTFTLRFGPYRALFFPGPYRISVTYFPGDQEETLKRRGLASTIKAQSVFVLGDVRGRDRLIGDEVRRLEKVIEGLEFLHWRISSYLRKAPSAPPVQVRKWLELWGKDFKRRKEASDAGAGRWVHPPLVDTENAVHRLFAELYQYEYRLLAFVDSDYKGMSLPSWPYARGAALARSTLRREAIQARGHPRPLLIAEAARLAGNLTGRAAAVSDAATRRVVARLSAPKRARMRAAIFASIVPMIELGAALENKAGGVSWESFTNLWLESFRNLAARLRIMSAAPDLAPLGAGAHLDSLALSLLARWRRISARRGWSFAPGSLLVTVRPPLAARLAALGKTFELGDLRSLSLYLGTTQLERLLVELKSKARKVAGVEEWHDWAQEWDAQLLRLQSKPFFTGIGEILGGSPRFSRLGRRFLILCVALQSLKETWSAVLDKKRTRAEAIGAEKEMALRLRAFAKVVVP